MSFHTHKGNRFINPKAVWIEHIPNQRIILKMAVFWDNTLFRHHATHSGQPKIPENPIQAGTTGIVYAQAI